LFFCFWLIEPPDVGNWFSSYAYESPELNTIEDFKYSNDSVVAETEKSPIECKQDLDRNVIVARSDDLLLEGKGTSDDVLDCKNPTIDDNFTSKVSPQEICLLFYCSAVCYAFEYELDVSLFFCIPMVSC
jgi:hypothetical protein